MEEKPESSQPDSPEAIRENIEETRRQLYADLEALERRVADSLSYNRIRSAMRENPLPWLIGGVGAGLLALGLIARRSRRASMPPLPPKGTRRRAIAETAAVAEKKGLLSQEARTILISLLTAEGVRWLRQYLATRARRTSEDLATRAVPVIDKAREATATTADRAQERLREVRQAAEDGVSRS